MTPPSSSLLFCCLGISNSRKHPSDYGISVSCGMLSLARALRLTVQRQHVCEILWVYWERLKFLAHKSPVLFDETCLWKRAISSHLLPSKTKKCKNYDFGANFNCIIILAENLFFHEQSLVKVHIPPPSVGKWPFPFSSCQEGILFQDHHK